LATAVTARPAPPQRPVAGVGAVGAGIAVGGRGVVHGSGIGDGTRTATGRTIRHLKNMAGRSNGSARYFFTPKREKARCGGPKFGDKRSLRRRLLPLPRPEILVELPGVSRTSAMTTSSQGNGPPGADNSATGSDQHAGFATVGFTSEDRATSLPRNAWLVRQCCESLWRRAWQGSERVRDEARPRGRNRRLVAWDERCPTREERLLDQYSMSWIKCGEDSLFGRHGAPPFLQAGARLTLSAPMPVSLLPVIVEPAPFRRGYPATFFAARRSRQPLH
jgi:hypothetical protein